MNRPVDRLTDNLPLVDDPATLVNDAATLRALRRLAVSRERLGAWVETMAERREESGGLFSPRSATMRTLLSLGAMKLPWLRWGFSALMLLRSFRRR